MALIRCPECKKKISDTCDKCIHCGCDLKKLAEESYYDTSDYDSPLRKVLKALGVIMGILLAAAAIALVIYILATYKQRGALNNEIMATAAILTFTAGVTMSVLCNRLL